MILPSLNVLSDLGWKDYALLTVAINPDEEVGSRGGGEFISATADQHDLNIPGIAVSRFQA